jgi:hypothetical protein
VEVQKANGGRGALNIAPSVEDTAAVERGMLVTGILRLDRVDPAPAIKMSPLTSQSLAQEVREED